MRELHVDHMSQAVRETCLEANYGMREYVRLARTSPPSGSPAMSSVSVKFSGLDLVFLTSYVSRRTPIDRR